ncbi:BTB/POZ domain-containing protein SR1IP1-like [Primulina eburnea]|uniref:BTB/POZ domain-containing protein SR1IP1-like n=1 Tax=Primulina eburnea TaxID=1245227 RepID=UPI003C6C33C0
MRMLDLDHNQHTTQSNDANISSKKIHRLSATMKRTSEWVFSQEIPTDVTVIAGGTSFSLHKFPLVSKSGYIRKLVSESVDADLSIIKLPDIPGGADAFELAAKFFYGVNFEISTENIAMLRCAAEFLEMTEDYAVGNLIGRTEAYINEVALTSLAGAVFILHSCENLFPVAENVKLVNRCIDTIAFIACRDSQFAAPVDPKSEELYDSVSYNFPVSKPIVDWWAEDLTLLRIDLFQRVIVKMISRGFKKYALGPILMLYAQKSLRGLELFGKGRKKIDTKQQYEKRVVLEMMVGLLPREKNSMPVSFLSMLLRAAIFLDTTFACRLDLEKMMASQLGQAVIDDLLIPSYSLTGDTLFDVETIQRIMMNFFENRMELNRVGYDVDQYYVSHPSHEKETVTRLMESYLAEIASDHNLSVPRFLDFAELIPEQHRVTDDGMYRAIDIYLKAHPELSDMERKKICSLMDCQKLSREACAHAAQNDRLPVQTVVQVLYHEQQRLGEVVDGGLHESSPALDPPKTQETMEIHTIPDEDSISTLQRENEILKLELMKMKMKLKDVENSSVKIPGDHANPLVISRTMSIAEKPLPSRKSLLSSVSRKLGRFIRPEGNTPGLKGRVKAGKDRRHSIS